MRHAEKVRGRMIGACVLVVTLWLSSGWPSVASANEQSSVLRALFLTHVLSTADGQIRKFPKSKNFSMWFDCSANDSKRCNTHSLYVKTKTALEAYRFVRFKAARQNPDLRVVFADGESAKLLANRPKTPPGKSFSDVTDFECQLSYSVNNHTIGAMEIVVSLDAPELKQIACIALQFPRGHGLSFPESQKFGDFWKYSAEATIGLTQVKIERLARLYAILLRAQRCDEILPGMNSEALAAIINNPATCSGSLLSKDLQ